MRHKINKFWDLLHIFGINIVKTPKADNKVNH